MGRTIHQYYKSMLQSEFFERTNVHLTDEEYARVEHIYNSVQMNKDEFCKLWLKNRDNQIISELMVTINKLESEVRVMKKEQKTAREHLETLGHDFIVDLHRPDLLYDILEEEFTLEFITKVKLQENIELDQHERDFLVTKLNG